MQHQPSLTRTVARLLAVFESRCTDRTTLTELSAMAADPGLWNGAYDLFQRIRGKTLRAERARQASAAAQYAFEEVCAKTLYNLSESPAPFDADSSGWIVPNALALAKVLGIPESEVRAAVTGKAAEA